MPSTEAGVQEMQSEALLRPKRSRTRRWTMRFMRVMVVGYIACAMILYFVQRKLIFPGAMMQGTPDAQVQLNAGEQLIELRAASGEKIMAIYGAATDKRGNVLPDAAERPTILFFYGNGECIGRSREHVTEFCSLGVNVLMPDYVGYGLSGGSPSQKGVLETADASYEYLTGVKHVDPARLVIVGKSLGGAAAIHLAANRPVGAVATFSAFTTLHEVAQKLVRYFPVGWLLKDNFDNIGLMARVHCPVFIAHGADDDFVPFSMAGRLAKAVDCGKCGQPTCVDVAGASHNDMFYVGGAELLGRFGEFVKGAVK